MSTGTQLIFCIMMGIVIGTCIQFITWMPKIVAALETIAKGCGR
jgi:hypothetical protein